MSGFDVEIRIDSAQVQALFARLAAAGDDLGPVMADLAEGLLHRTEERFDRQTAPDGSRWPALSPGYAARKRTRGYTGPLLVREGRLRGELRSAWGADFAEVATAPLAYAALHQFGGTPNMAPGPTAVPARPYLGVSRDDLTWIEQAVADHLERLTAAG